MYNFLVARANTLAMIFNPFPSPSMVWGVSCLHLFCLGSISSQLLHGLKSYYQSVCLLCTGSISAHHRTLDLLVASRVHVWALTVLRFGVILGYTYTEYTIQPAFFLRDTNLADLSLQHIPLILTDIILVNPISFIKNISVCQFIYIR